MQLFLRKFFLSIKLKMSDKLAIIAVFISVVTLALTYYSFQKSDNLSVSAFNRNYRPYIGAFSYSFIKDSSTYPQMNVLMMKIFNAPAYITKKQVSFYSREGGKENLIFKHPNYKGELMYPFDNTPNYIFTDIKIINHDIAVKILPRKLVRKVRIEYQWISDNSLKYFLESEWEYNLMKSDWDIIFQDAN